MTDRPAIATLEQQGLHPEAELRPAGAPPIVRPVYEFQGDVVGGEPEQGQALPAAPGDLHDLPVSESGKEAQGGPKAAPSIGRMERLD
jgi:hypothetical protein